MTASGNLFADLPQDATREHVVELLRSSAVTIERIVSYGQGSPPGFWYDQDWAEWVIVLQGSAVLLIDGEAAPRRLQRGDYVHLPAHTRHRVEWTEAAEPTVWLAVHHR